MPGVTLPSAGSSTKKVDIGPRRLRRAQRRFQRPGTGIRRCRDSNPGAGNLGSVPSPGLSCAIPLRERVCCGWEPEGVAPSRPVSARLGPPDPSDVAARLQRAERPEPRDGCLMVVVGDPSGVFGRTSPSRWRMGSCASPRAVPGTAHPWLVQISGPDLSTEPTHNPKAPAGARPGRFGARSSEAERRARTRAATRRCSGRAARCPRSEREEWSETKAGRAPPRCRRMLLCSRSAATPPRNGRRRFAIDRMLPVPRSAPLMRTLPRQASASFLAACPPT
jgi:hypothetical protein